MTIKELLEVIKGNISIEIFSIIGKTNDKVQFIEELEIGFKNDLLLKSKYLNESVIEIEFDQWGITIYIEKKKGK